MSHVTWDALAATPLPEVRRRAAVMDDLAGVAPVAVPGARRLAWNDDGGGGQSAVWHFAEDGRVLLLTFDHESALNLYAEEDFALQESFLCVERGEEQARRPAGLDTAYVHRLAADLLDACPEADRSRATTASAGPLTVSRPHAVPSGRIRDFWRAVRR
ncbi:hypothetical protein [Embleya sp. NPDC020630]|uniref:hypothetical protein n=1 Tax=Embleya sp. NPDC020630 TaxID=3363979 RepID=UPI0037A34CBA